MKIVAIIECNDNGYYQISSRAEIMGHCLGGYGYSETEAKADFLKSIDEAREMIAADGLTVPADAAHVEVDFRYA